MASADDRWRAFAFLLAAALLAAAPAGVALGQGAEPRRAAGDDVQADAGAESAPGSPSSTPPDGSATDANGDTGGDDEATSVFDELDESLLRLAAENTLWSWGMLLGGVLLGLAAGKVAAVALRVLGRRVERRGWAARAHVITDLTGPARLALLTLGLALGLATLTMSPALRGFASKTLLLLYTIAVFWYAYNLIGVLDAVVRHLAGRGAAGLDEQVIHQLTPLVRKSLRIFLVVIGALFVADSVFEQNIGALLAGLGIAGLAVSLAAQDSLKNLFGSITILFDRPFQLGERIVYGGYDGVIEEIGFRSTKVRTLTGHLVNIPNSVIVNSPVENIGRRPYIRRLFNITITYDTPRAKIEQAVEILRGILEEDGIREPIHATIDGDEFPPRVYFKDFGAASLDILVIYWHAPPAYWDYLEHAQRVNLRIFEEFEKAGIEFAFPTQTLFLAGDPKRKLAVEMLGRDLQNYQGGAEGTQKS